MSDAEQGKVQGLLAALRSFASAGTGAAVSSVGFRPGGRDRGSLRGGLCPGRNGRGGAEGASGVWRGWCKSEAGDLFAGILGVDEGALKEFG